MSPLGAAAALSLLISASATAGPSVDVTSDCVTVTKGDHKLSASLTDAVLTLTTPFRAYTFTPFIDQSGGWVKASRCVSKPGVEAGRSHAHASIHYPVEGNRLITLELDAYRGIPAIFVRSKLRVTGSWRPEYYFWAWQGTFDHYFVPGLSGPERREPDKGKWGRLGYQDWVFLPADTGGLMVMPTGELGRAPGDKGEPYVHALPRSKSLEPGDSLDVAFGLAGVKDASEAERIWSMVAKRSIPALRRSPEVNRKIDYGKPAPDWLRNAEIYNGYYHQEQDWNRANIREWLASLPLVVGVPHDKAVIDRCHRAGIRVIPYVNYMELLNTDVEKKAKGSIYYEWLQAVDHDCLDMKDHPDWICIDAEGRDVHSVWGQNNGHPGLYYTCFQMRSLQDAALAQVRKLMEMGADGVFIDNAGAVFDCFGPRFGKHQHPEPGKTNTQMYELLQERIYELVKSFGGDKIVMQNNGIISSHWRFCDTQMWEACMYGAGTKERLNEWEELRYAGEDQADAVAHGKVPVILSYLGSQPEDSLRDCALYTYAFCRLYGFLWADWFTLDKTEDDRNLAKAIYAARLGKPMGGVKNVGGVFRRAFEKGIVLLNSARAPANAVVCLPNAIHPEDLGYSRKLTAKDGRLRLEMAPESGRVLLW